VTSGGLPEDHPALSFLDTGTFQFLALPKETFRTIPAYDRKASPGNGVTVGFGRADNRPVAVFVQDPAVSGGSLGLGEAEKICALMDAAVERGCPIVGFLHSGGARIQEGVDSLAGYGEIFERNVRYSGEVPQVSVVLGPCAGGAVYSPALTDFVVLVRDRAQMFITGPDVIRQSTGEQTDRESLGGAAVHLTRSGVGHFGAETGEAAGRLARRILSYLPSRRGEAPPRTECADEARSVAPPAEWSGGDRRRAFEVRTVVESAADAGSFLEVQADYARNIVIGFARFGGHAVGVVANNSAHLAGALDSAASEKAARFVRLCDGFGLPVITFVDVPGYWPGVALEHDGIIRRGAKLLYAYAEATVPKLTVVLHKAYGGAYDVMGSKHLGADYNAAWPTAELAVMGPRGAVEILCRRELAEASDPETVRAGKIAEYVEKFANPRQALERGYLDEVFPPSETRARLCAKLRELLAGKRPLPARRGNIPL
jgi:acetyl-CoA carboxylase carboxyltransferase component